MVNKAQLRLKENHQTNPDLRAKIALLLRRRQSIHLQEALRRHAAMTAKRGVSLLIATLATHATLAAHALIHATLHHACQYVGLTVLFCALRKNMT